MYNYFHNSIKCKLFKCYFVYLLTHIYFELIYCMDKYYVLSSLRDDLILTFVENI